MSNRSEQPPPADAGPVGQPVRPCAWAHRYSPRGLLHALRDNQQDAEDDAAIVGGSAHVVALYDELALAAAVAAERAESARLRRLLNLARDDYNTAAQRLQDIGDYAHDHSTGPAVPDALWEVRSMAYGSGA